MLLNARESLTTPRSSLRLARKAHYGICGEPGSRDLAADTLHNLPGRKNDSSALSPSHLESYQDGIKGASLSLPTLTQGVWQRVLTCLDQFRTVRGTNPIAHGLPRNCSSLGPTKLDFDRHSSSQGAPRNPFSETALGRLPCKMLRSLFGTPSVGVRNCLPPATSAPESEYVKTCQNVLLPSKCGERPSAFCRLKPLSFKATKATNIR